MRPIPFYSNRADRGFTLIELLVVIAIIAILASMLLPSLSKAREKSKSTKCQSNLRQLVLAAIMYEEDNQKFPIGFPTPDLMNQPLPPIWYRQLQPYVGRKETISGQGVFICPSSLQRVPNGSLREGGFSGILAYAQNGQINNGRKDIGARHLKDPSNTILYADTDGWDACLYPDGQNGANVCYRHSGGNDRSAETERGVAGKKLPKFRANAGFADAHVELIRKAPLRLFTLEAD